MTTLGGSETMTGGSETMADNDGGGDGNLALVRKVGHGGFGAVWEARWRGAPAAVKVLVFSASMTREARHERMALMEVRGEGAVFRIFQTNTGIPFNLPMHIFPQWPRLAHWHTLICPSLLPPPGLCSDDRDWHTPTSPPFLHPLPRWPSPVHWHTPTWSPPLPPPSAQMAVTGALAHPNIPPLPSTLCSDGRDRCTGTPQHRDHLQVPHPPTARHQPIRATRTLLLLLCGGPSQHPAVSRQWQGQQDC